MRYVNEDEEWSTIIMNGAYHHARLYDIRDNVNSQLVGCGKAPGSSEWNLTKVA